MPYQIYLVEDHPTMREAYTALIARAPDFSMCGTAESAEEALDALPGSTCDLVVADISLPGMDGIELVRRLTTLRPDLPAVIISGHDDASVVRRAHEAGARRFLSKDDVASHLAPTLRLVLQEARGGAAPEAAA